ncbi:MAG TPA: hypothetical protein VFE88_01155 [Candidatus Nanoarchaeia archaeon]|nr:hypothetical protein [Candidatus Nanoarchaeia archaeon]
MQKTVARDTPLAELTLRKYERPNPESKRDLIRKVCLSVGLLQPGDSRDIIVDIFQVLLEAKGPMNAEMLQREVIECRKRRKLALQGIAASNIRRQVRRLRDLFLVEKVNNQYRIAENEDLHTLFEEKIKKFYLNSILTRVEEYFKALK